MQYGTGYSAAIYGRDIAGKTGTADNWTDAWFVGFTPQLSTAIWVGNRDFQEFLSFNEGGVMCAPVWNQFMRNALADMPNRNFEWQASPGYRANGDFMTEQEREEKRKKETDSDGDGFSDWDEEQAGTDPFDPNDYPGKLDQDKLMNMDSDGDGWSDWDEIQFGTNPHDPTDYPGAPPKPPSSPGIPPPTLR